MFEITDGNTVNKLVVSSYVPCARNITSGNLSVNRAHYLVKKVAQPGNVDTTFIKAGNTKSTKCYQSEYKFGECVKLSANGTVTGYDYLGNKIVEAVSANTASTHAFFKVTEASISSAGSAVALATTGIVGLEFQTAKVDSVIVDGVDTEAVTDGGDDPDTTNWTFAGFDNTQTGSSDGDTRGTVDLSALYGKEVEILYTVTEFCVKDAAGNDSKGGLFGVLPYAG